MRKKASLSGIVTALAIVIAALGAACDARTSDPPAEHPKPAPVAEHSAALNGSSYTCSGGVCVCSEQNTFDCWNMEMFECCPNPKPGDIFCGDEVCSYEGKKCKCTQKSPGPVSAQAGSCSGRCGNYDGVPSHCQCDSACASYGDCCRDYGATCLPAKRASCSCNFDCAWFGNCCQWCSW